MNPEFKSFQKIPRLNREIIITEKIDGTNALVWVSDCETEIKSGSRSRWITPEDDNYGFAKWVESNKEELLKLGKGYHYGEWWGHGIQRGYGVKEKIFSLFNVGRWNEENKPECCHVVPTLERVMINDFVYGISIKSSPWKAVLSRLSNFGSSASPGFMNPEGIIVYHTAANQLFKVTIEDD